MGERLLVGHLELSMPDLFFLSQSGKIEQPCKQKLQATCFLYTLSSKDNGSDLPWVNTSRSGIKLAESNSAPGSVFFFFFFCVSVFVYPFFSRHSRLFHGLFSTEESSTLERIVSPAGLRCASVKAGP